MKKKPEPSDFRKILDSLSGSRGTYEVFSAFVKLAACAVAVQTREEEYAEAAKRWKPDELEAFSRALAALVDEMEQKPFTDVLGGYYMEYAISSKGQQWGGEFHTPKPVCDLMARMVMGDMELIPKDRCITVCEPACGAGAMVLSLAEACSPEVRRRLRVTAIDINEVACDMCFINTMLWHVPTRVLHGNTISMEFWRGWTNFALMASPWAYHGDVDDVGRQNEPPKAAEVEIVKQALEQQELKL
ncbi:MAG: SAM-dependent DNA methyltransferase [Patescibacteria group bacterium]|nr:SAM-dependent DNA methyltransferase [Patescibacteria group bacterium]